MLEEIRLRLYPFHLKDRMIWALAIGLIALDFGLAVALIDDNFVSNILNAQNFARLFESGYYADPDSAYSKYLESIGGSTMIESEP